MKKLLSIVFLVLPLLFFTYGCDKSEAVVAPSVSNKPTTEITSVIETEKTTEKVKVITDKSTEEAQEVTDTQTETAVKEVTEVAMSPEHNGGEIFKANCAACHAGGVNRIMANKSLMKDDLVKYDMYSQEAIIYQVTNGKNAMPPFKGRLSPEEIQTVADYVLQQADNGWS